MITEELKIYCKNTEEYIDVDGGDTLAGIYATLHGRLQMVPLCALVNNQEEDLCYRIYRPHMVEYLDIGSKAGYAAYVRSMCMILYKAITELFPGSRLMVEHSIAGGLYCTFKHEAVIPKPAIEALKRRMREIVDADLPFVRRERLTADVIDMFDKQGLKDKVRLLKSINRLYTVYYKLGDVIDSFSGPLVPSTGLIQVFDIVPYHDGMLVLPPDGTNPSQPAKKINQPKLLQAFTDHIEFNKIIGLGDVGTLNKVVQDGNAPMLINVAEALHNQAFAKIAEEIAKRYQKGGARCVLIAGPSSSGKTTSSKRLAIQLVTKHIRPKVIELDNYFVDREHTPRDEKGDFDYESLYALDLKQFNHDITALLAGEEVPMPTYNFSTGAREYRGNTLRLEQNDILLMEGIHGLNPELTKQIPDNQKFRVFVSALSTLNIDDHNWIDTYDARLLRRIVRDNRYRGINAQETLSRWASVRRGEEKWIMPFSENADAMFNSSLLFELAVLKSYAEPLLRQVPVNKPEFAEADRLLKFLSYFEPLDVHNIPSTSLIREFLGGSAFHYS